MKLIDGTEIIDNSFNERAGELAERIYDDLIYMLDIQHKCIIEDEDGNTSDTDFGTDIFSCIYEHCLTFLEGENE